MQKESLTSEGHSGFIFSYLVATKPMSPIWHVIRIGIIMQSIDELAHDIRDVITYPHPLDRN